MKTLVTGGTGFVGRRLLTLLDQVALTTRNRQRALARVGPDTEVVEWKSTEQPLELSSAGPFDSVVNLMGESIAEGRWTATKKERIRNSRVEGTKRLVESLLGLPKIPEVVVSASAVGIYGDCGDDVVSEDYRIADGFLADVCQEWEDATIPLSNAGVRVVLIRIGIVLGHNGGALEKLVPLFKRGLGGRLGNGKHFVPWIHIDDLCQMIVWAIDNPNVKGALNATAPNPVRNSHMTKALASAVRRPALFPAPKFALRLVLGEFANSLFSSQQVVPKAALDAGYQFKFNTIEDAILDIVQ